MSTDRRAAFAFAIAAVLLTSAAAAGALLGQSMRSAIAAPMIAPGNLPNSFTVTISNANNCPCVGGGTTIPLSWNPAFIGIPSAIKVQPPGGWTGAGNFGNCGHPFSVAVFFDQTFSCWRFQFAFGDNCNNGVNAVAALTFDADKVKGSFPVVIELPQCGCGQGTSTISVTVP